MNSVPDNQINFVFPYYPQIPDPKKVIYQCKKELFQDHESRRAFSDGFRVAFERGKNIENLLCRAKLWPMRPNDSVDRPGWYSCAKCIACKYAAPTTNKIKLHYKNLDFDIKSHITCKMSNIIYVIECNKCKLQSVGSTTTTFRQRSSGWRSDIKINVKVDKVISHFNLISHNIETNFKMTPLELVHGNEDILRLRERMYIDKFDLIGHGLNTKRT